MACSGCGASLSRVSYAQYASVQNPQTPDPNCPYTLDQLEAWKNLLACVKDKNIYDVFKISFATWNSYNGYVLSAINNYTNICYFRPQLDLINILIVKIVNSGLC